MRADLPCGRMIGTAVCDRISFGKYIRLYPIIICTPDFQHISACAHPLKQRKPRSPVPSGTAGPFREIVARFWVMSYILNRIYLLLRLYTLVYQIYSVIISLYRLRAGRHEAVQTRAKDPEGPARAEKVSTKTPGISKHITG